MAISPQVANRWFQANYTNFWHSRKMPFGYLEGLERHFACCRKARPFFRLEEVTEAPPPPKKKNQTSVAVVVVNLDLPPC